MLLSPSMPGIPDGGIAGLDPTSGELSLGSYGTTT
jgi:hypothetical protein